MQTYVDAIKAMVQWFPVMLLFNHTMTHRGARTCPGSHQKHLAVTWRVMFGSCLTTVGF